MKRIFLVVLVAMSMRLVRGAEAPAVIDRPAAGNGPTQVSIGIWIVDISKIDSAEQSFTAEVASDRFCLRQLPPIGRLC